MQKQIYLTPPRHKELNNGQYFQERGALNKPEQKPFWKC